MASMNKKKNFTTSKLDLSLKKKPVKCYLWNIAVCGTAIGYFGK
jgi:hypothetical protein